VYLLYFSGFDALHISSWSVIRKKVLLPSSGRTLRRKIFVHIYQITQYHTSENRGLDTHHHEHLTSYSTVFFLYRLQACYVIVRFWWPYVCSELVSERSLLSPDALQNDNSVHCMRLLLGWNVCRLQSNNMVTTRIVLIRRPWVTKCCNVASVWYQVIRTYFAWNICVLVCFAQMHVKFGKYACVCNFKAVEVVEVELHRFLTTALNGDSWSHSYSEKFLPVTTW
jgi:hypothetical protein